MFPSIVQRALLALALMVPQVAQEAPRLEVSQSAWTDAPDATDFAESLGYRELVAALLALQPAQIDEQHPQALDHARALADPASLRGAFVKVRGRVMGKLDVPLSAPIGQQASIERAIVMLDKDHWVACDLVGGPPPFDLKRDTLELSGVFYRTVQFEAGPEKKVQVMPYVLARSLALVETPGSGLMKSLLGGGRQLFVGVLLGLGAVVLLVLYLRQSARSES
jgi:hypothetical protein